MTWVNLLTVFYMYSQLTFVPRAAHYTNNVVQLPQYSNHWYLSYPTWAYCCSSFLCPCVALEDDTDELLELIAKSDGLLTPTKPRRHTPGVLMYNETRSSPFNKKVHSSSSHSSLDSNSYKSAQFSDEAEAYTDRKVKRNFTPAPIPHSSQPHLNKSPPTNAPGALKELVNLLQRWVQYYSFDTLNYFTHLIPMNSVIGMLMVM